MIIFLYDDLHDYHRVDASIPGLFEEFWFWTKQGSHLNGRMAAFVVGDIIALSLWSNDE